MRILANTFAACVMSALLACGADPTPPELTRRDPDRGTELAFKIARHEKRADGSHSLTLVARWNGRPVGFDLELAPWQENPPGFIDMSTWECKVRWLSRGDESDELLMFMDELYATAIGTDHMIDSVELQAFSPWKNPGDFEDSAIVRLLFQPNDFEDRGGELKLEIDLDDERVYLREVDTTLRRSVIWRLSAPPTSS